MKLAVVFESVTVPPPDSVVVVPPNSSSVVFPIEFNSIVQCSSTVLPDSTSPVLLPTTI